MLSAHELRRYKDIARLLFKHGGHGLLERFGLGNHHDPDTDGEGGGTPRELVDDIAGLGPSFVKLGQALSTRADLLPPEYLDAFSELQDKVGPFPYEQVQETVERELGVKISQAFLEFNEEPLAAASLGQVHRAVLRDGREVVVKVQRPDIEETIRKDFDLFAGVAGLLDERTESGRVLRYADSVREFRIMVLRELDYREEARNLVTLGRAMASYEDIVVPQPVADYTTGRVLTMDMIHGSKITELSGAVRLELDGDRLADTLLRAYLQQILVDGFFHADPHPGNIVITRDRKIALLDLGTVGRVGQSAQSSLLRIILATSEGDGDAASEAALHLCTPLDTADLPGFRREVGRLVSEAAGREVSESGAGIVLIRLVRVAADYGVRPAPELSILGRTLLHLDRVAGALAPEFNPGAAVQRHVTSILNERTLKSFSPSHLLGSVMDVKELAEEFPARANRIMGLLADNELEIRVNAFDQGLIMKSIEKIANRITSGLVLAALIVGAALLMQVQTDFRLFGYPGLAILLFLGAAVLGFWLVVTILFGDRDSRQGRTR